MPSYRFAEFELNEADFCLTRAGQRIALEPKALRVLTLLVTRAGRLVDKQELLESVWPNTFVEENTLTRTIWILRRELGDNPRNSKLIETVPTRGYRFIAPVEVLPDSSSSPGKAVDDLSKSGATEVEAPVPPPDIPGVTVEPDRPTHRRPSWLKVSAGVLAISLAGLAAFVVYRWHRQRQPGEQAVLNAVPFTALPGMENHPAFSPDGSRIAFMWNPGSGANGIRQSDLYVKALGSETLLRLTQHPSTDLIPAWSPDGTQIAFYRRAGSDSGIYVVPALGGPEQKLRSTRDIDRSGISWSPDGKWIAFEDLAPGVNHVRIYLLSPETLAIRQIPNNPACFEEHLPAFSHNGKYLAYWCFRNEIEASLYFLSVPDGTPKVITSSWEGLTTGLTWSTDDKKLIYSRFRDYTSDELFEVSAGSGPARQLGLAGTSPAVSPQGGKLAYSSSLLTESLWRRDLLHPEVPPAEFVPSSRAQYDSQYSPDGKRIVFASERTGVRGVWVSNEDGSNLVQISDPRYLSGSPQWSPDGNKIAFDSLHDQIEIWVADVAERKPIKLVTNISFLVRPNWSHDGKWIYFASREPGREGIYRCPVSGGDATLLSKDIHPANPRESFDGKTLYFARDEGSDIATLKKVALSGQPGTESEIDPSIRVNASQSWLLSSSGIYFVPAESPRSVRFFEFASRRVRTIFESDHVLRTGFSISPDGRWILYAQLGDPTGDIMLVDHFR